jgi:lipoate-protein ligase A
MSSLRLIYDAPASGVWNMAADEMMLETVAATGQPILRFYAWEEPTLSLGYFQAVADRETHAASRNCTLVRRSTGGGAILHDDEITYSIAMPLADRWSSQAASLYDVFHGSLVAALGEFGVVASLCEATLHPLEGEPFLCFQRRAKGDVLVEGQKVAGSAQRRRHGALLQHGSILLGRSAAAPELAGLKELGLPVAVGGQLIATWLKHLTVRFPLAGDTSPGEWDSFERGVITQLVSDRFATPDWTGRRGSR